MCGCGHETWASACLGGDATLLSAATAGLKSKRGRLAAGSLLGLPFNAVPLTCAGFVDCAFACGGGFGLENAAQTGA